MRTFGRWYSADAAGGGDAPVEVAAPVVEAAPVETPAPPSEAPPDPVAEAWNGELEHLGKQPWFTTLAEDHRKAVEGGVKEKLRNLESGFGKKFGELAEERKRFSAWEAEKAELQGRVTKAEDDAALFKDLFGGDDGEWTTKIEAAKLEAVKPYEEKVKAFEAAQTELAELRTFKKDYEAYREAEFQNTVEKEAARLIEKLAEVKSHPDALDKFERLVKAGIDEDEALSYVKRHFDIKKPVMPEAAAFASRGDGPSGIDTMPAGGSLDERVEWAAERAARKLGHRA